MKHLLIAALFGCGVIAATPASAFFLPDPVEDEELVAVNGRCFVRQHLPNGSVRQYPCSWDSALDEFSDDAWDDLCEDYGHLLSRAEYLKYCTPGSLFADSDTYFRINDRFAFSDIRIAVDPGFVLTPPYQRGFLETQVGGNFVTPALNLDVNTTGFQVGIGFDATLHIDRFMPIKTHFDVEFGYSRGTGSASNVPFPNGLGTPNTGNGNFGGWNGANTTLSNADLTIDRTFASFDKGIGLPLAAGSHRFGDDLSPTTIDWDLSLLAGLRGGILGERQTFTADAINGGPSHIEYNTDIAGGFLGGYVGLGLDKFVDLPDTDLALVKSFYLLGGLSHYMFSVNDTVSGSGPSAPPGTSSNHYTASATIPTIKAGASIGLGGDGFRLNLDTGVKVGYNPPVDIKRPLSSDLSAAEFVVLASIVNLYLTMSLTVPIDPT